MLLDRHYVHLADRVISTIWDKACHFVQSQKKKVITFAITNRHKISKLDHASDIQKNVSTLKGIWFSDSFIIGPNHFSLDRKKSSTETFVPQISIQYPGVKQRESNSLLNLKRWCFWCIYIVMHYISEQIVWQY